MAKAADEAVDRIFGRALKDVTWPESAKSLTRQDIEDAMAKVRDAYWNPHIHIRHPQGRFCTDCGAEMVPPPVPASEAWQRAQDENVKLVVALPEDYATAWSMVQGMEGEFIVTEHPYVERGKFYILDPAFRPLVKFEWHEGEFTFVEPNPNRKITDVSL